MNQITLYVGQQIQAIVEKVVFSGYGLIRYQGIVIFVEDVIAGEEVACEIIEKKKNYYIAKVLKIIQSASSRIVPKCPHFGTCGGCVLQHMSYESQIELKKTWIIDAFWRIAKSTLPQFQLIPSSSEWEYRRHVVVHGQITPNNVQLGYVNRTHDSILNVITCPIFTYREDPLFIQIREQLINIAARDLTFDLRIIKMDTHCFYFHIIFRQNIEKNVRENFIEALYKVPYCTSITFEEPLTRPDPSILYTFDFDGERYFFSPYAFLQNHSEQSGNIYRYVEMVLAQEKGNISTLIDLYCGIGVLSLRAAKIGIKKVVGVELNAHAIVAAKKTQAQMNVENVQFFAEDATVFLASYRGKVDFLIINPPRIGLERGIINIILKKLPRHIIYISCNPQTLARDYTFFKEYYEIISMRSFDMFPETTHIETVIELKRKELR